MPPNNGGRARVLGLAEILSQFAEVDLLAYGDRTTGTRVSDSPYRMVYSVARPSGLFGLIGQSLRALGGAPLRSIHVGTVQFKRRLQGLVASGRYDAVQVEELSMMVPLVHGTVTLRLPIVFSTHNVETELSPQVHRNAGPHLRLLSGIDTNRTRAVERAALALAWRAIVVSQADLRCMASLVGCDPTRCVVIPNCCASSIRPQAPTDGAEILFVGSLGWRPNIDGLEWFLDDVLWRIRNLVSDTSIRVVGSKLPRKLSERLRKAGCAVSENVPDLNPFYARARVAIVPLRLGGGTRIKIVEAWAAGVPVVSTSVGAHGLLEDERSGVLVADTASEFAAAVARVISSDDTYLELRQQGLRRSHAHRWPAWGGALERLYGELVSAAPPGAALEPDGQTPANGEWR